MQVVIRRFFDYPGFRLGGPLKAYPIPPWERKSASGDFGVGVRVHPELLMGQADGVVPTREEAQEVERALTWVLWALFAYSERLLDKELVYW